MSISHQDYTPQTCKSNENFTIDVFIEIFSDLYGRYFMVHLRVG